MPVTVRPQKRYDCSLDGCDNDRTPASTVAGSYCSRECADRSDGRALLRDIRQDHRFCWSCFRQRKEVERPTDEARSGWSLLIDEAVVGYEYPTEFVEQGPYGLECKCGALDHDDPVYDQRHEGPFERFLQLASERFVADGRRNDAVDAAALTDEFRVDSDEDVPLELAVGRSLEV